MKKHWKLASIMLITALISGGVYSLIVGVSNTQVNNLSLSTTDNELQSQSRAITGIGDVEFTLQSNGNSNFSIVKDAVNGDRVYAWGINTDGQLGVGDTNNKTVPTPVIGLPVDAQVRWVKGGNRFTLVVLADNTIWAAGTNDRGVFGNGETSDTAAPTFKLVKSYGKDQVIKSFDVSEAHSAIIVDEKLYTWGINSFGQLGIGGLENQSSHTEVKSLSGRNLTEVKLSTGSTFVSTLDLGATTIKEIYAFGLNIQQELGLNESIPTNKDLPVLIPLAYTGDNRITNFFPSSQRVYFTSYDGTKTHLYVSGRGSGWNIGNGEQEKPTKLTELDISVIPAGTKISNIYMYWDATFLRTPTGDIYSCGKAEYAALPANSGVFVKNNLTNVAYMAGSARIYNTNIFAISNNQLLAWGNNTNGGYGIGDVTTNYPTPTPIELFSSKLSTLAQIKFDSAVTAYDLYKKIYNATTGADFSIIDQWVSKTDFPPGTKFTVTSAPTVNGLSKEITLKINASIAYAAPDGVRALNQEMPITLTGFKAPLDSILQVKGTEPWLTMYEYDNVISSLGEGKTTNTSDLAKIYDLGLFPDGTTFEIDSPKITYDKASLKGTYTARLVASKYYLNGTLYETKQPFDIVFNNFDVHTDSQITLRTNIDTNYYNLTNIEGLLFPNGTLNKDVFDILFQTLDFPAGATISAAVGKVSGNEYIFNATATEAWVNGLISENANLTLKVTGLVLRPDSTIVLRTDINTKLYNLTNIDRKLQPNGTLDQKVFSDIFIATDFPSGVAITVASSNIKDGLYYVNFLADQSWVDGFNKKKEDFNLAVSGLVYRPDSEVKPLSPFITEFDSVTKVFVKDEFLDSEVLGKLIDLKEFPDGSTYLINEFTIDANGSAINFKFTPNRVYKDGDDVSNDTNKSFETSVKFGEVPVTNDSTGLIVGLVIGGILLVLIVVGLVIWYKKYHGKNNSNENQSENIDE